jgi:hypothetical protein
MKKLIKLSFTNSKYYHCEELIEGVNKLFKHTWTPKGWEKTIMYIYLYNGQPIANTFDRRFDVCKKKFNIILNAKGDYNKLTFECKHKLETI